MGSNKQPVVAGQLDCFSKWKTVWKNVCRRPRYMYSIVLTLIRLMKSILEIAKLLINILIECLSGIILSRWISIHRK